ncbi:methyltransferase regulatory domain-containing protein [Vulcanococcus limneticus Candia 3F8]|nr:methyltransferase regulatory domain-containing protein [Vulcanococcus limneticus MW73D5]MCP9895052.1 methyltransferase regulatory domain-containing protein [Vulcanococcus limneticus Candia 3F8]MCP9898516.1 methyltransferase regulatory domain-containing protein [Vulcanococcus limneticus Candia 3B3]
MGFGLALVAALHPDGEFIGVDFNPNHISHAVGLCRRLKITNVRFLEADFVALAHDLTPLGPRVASEGGGFHYVVAHGIATWARQPVQEAMLSVAAEALRPAGLFYCSYNSQPGWLGRSAFQKLYALERSRSDPATPHQPFLRTIERLRPLLGTAEQPSPLGYSLPLLAADLDSIDLSHLDYLCGEYANDGWQPLYVADFHQRCLNHKLAPLGTATLPEAFDNLLAPSLQGPILEERNALIRQTLIDLATNKSFRRDLFVKGLDPLTLQDCEQRLAGLKFVAYQLPSLADAEKGGFTFATVFGKVQGDPAIYGPIAQALAAGPRTIGQLQELSGQPTAELLMILSLFLDAGWISFDRGDMARKATTTARACNPVLMELIAGGRPYGHLLLPQIGTAGPISLVEVLIYRAMADNLKGVMLATCVLMGIEQLGVHLLANDNKPIDDADKKIERIEALAAEFSAQKLPMLRRLGCLPAPQQR